MASSVQVVLREDVPNLGKTGQMVRVRQGYARNYLVPRGMVVAATVANVRQVEHEKTVALARAAKLRAGAEALRAGLDGLSITLSKPAGEEGRLFGSVTHKDIAEALQKQGHVVDRRKVVLEHPIKTLGEHEAKVFLAAEIVATIKINVVGSN